MRRRGIFAALAVVLGAVVFWRLCGGDELAPGAGGVSTTDARAGDGTAAKAPQAADPPDRGAREAAATPPDPNAATKGLQLRVRLRGLDAKAPWTAPLQLLLTGCDATSRQFRHFDSEAAPDAAGLATFVVPDWCATASPQEGYLEASDPHYRLLEHVWTDRIDPARELVIDVQVIATLRGRVVDEAGKPVPAARITAIALRGGSPVGGNVGRTNSGADGTFRLDAAPDTQLFLLVAPMRMVRPGVMVSLGPGQEADDGTLRDDLLPASTITRGAIGEAALLTDIVLPRGAPIAGIVRWSDGSPVRGARVQTLPDDGTLFPLEEGAAIERHADGRLSPIAAADTADDGTFSLPGVPGVAVDVAVCNTTSARIVGEFQLTVAPPQRAGFVLPRPTRLRATDGQQPVAGAAIDVADGERLLTDDHGTLALVTSRPLRVRALHGRLRSPWLDVPTSAAGTTVDLVMTNARLPLAIEFAGDFRVRNTVVTWRRDDGLEGREHLLRDDRGGAFEVFLEPGRYHVTAGPGGGERNGVFLLPVERDVELDGPTTLTLPAVFGGSFSVMVTDSSGVWVGGTCQLHDRSGADHTDRFRVQDGAGPGREGRVGELLADGVNRFTRILPPGDYELMCDFGSHGAHREIVKVRPREITEVRIRLP